jgi:hypothetical protein
MPTSLLSYVFSEFFFQAFIHSHDSSAYLMTSDFELIKPDCKSLGYKPVDLLRKVNLKFFDQLHLGRQHARLIASQN